MPCAWRFASGHEAGDSALGPLKTVRSFDAVAPPMRGVRVVPAQWIAAVFDRDDLVEHVAVWVRIAQAVVDGLPADVASFAGGLASCSEFVSGVAVLPSWIAIHGQLFLLAFFRCVVFFRLAKL